MPAPDSPRTADKLAKSRAFIMLTNANEQVKAINMDRTWEKRLGDYQSKKAAGERHQREKIVSRQREVANQHVLKLQEMEADDEEAKQLLSVRLQEYAREEEEAQLSARSSAERQAQQYEQHLAAMRRREQLMDEMDKAAMVRLREQQDNLDAASKRLNAIKKQQAAKASDNQKLFAERRKAIFEKRKDESNKREKERAEYHKREAMIAKRGAEFEARRQAEWSARASASEDAMMSTSRSLSSALSERHAQQLSNWDADMEEMNARIEGLRSSRTDHAKMHAKQHRDRLMRHAEKKAEQVALKEDAFQQRKIETQGRLDKLSSARADRQRKVEREIHDEFQLKSNLENLKWEMSIKNANPDRVRQGLGGIRAPIPSMP